MNFSVRQSNTLDMFSCLYWQNRIPIVENIIQTHAICNVLFSFFFISLLVTTKICHWNDRINLSSNECMLKLVCCKFKNILLRINCCVLHSKYVMLIKDTTNPLTIRSMVFNLNIKIPSERVNVYFILKMSFPVDHFIP